MKRSFIFLTIGLLSLFVLSCTNIKEGYLITDNANIRPDSIVIPLHLDSELNSDMIENEAPILSYPLSGYSGTAPIRFRVVSVHTDNGYTESMEDISTTPDGRIQIRYGYTLPVGNYWIDIEIYNDDHSVVKTRIFKVIVKDEPLLVSNWIIKQRLDRYLPFFQFAKTGFIRFLCSKEKEFS